MHFETLKIFCDVVRHQSFSRGASENAVSQSAASQAIHHLEQRLGAQLIDRSKRPWLLTEEGKLFFEGCQDIVARYQELEASVRPDPAPAGYKVHVAAIYSVGMHNMSQYVETFRTLLPGADVDLEYMRPDQVYERVFTDKADLGLISFARHPRELTAIPWRSEAMVVACPPNHPFSQEKAIDPAHLAGERFVAFERNLPIRREMGRFLRRLGVEVELVAEFDNIETIKQAVEEGAGISILPEPTLRREVERGALVAVPFKGAPFVRPLSIIHRRKRRLHPAVIDFIKLLCEDGVLARGIEPGGGAMNIGGGMGNGAGGGNGAGKGSGGRGNGTELSGAGRRVGKRDSGKSEHGSRNGERPRGSHRSGPGSKRRVRRGHEQHG